MFETQQFVDDCKAALAADPTHNAVREVVAAAVAAPGEMLADLGTPTAAGVKRIHYAPDLTILSVVWAPYMSVMPHDHNMWAVIGVYAG